MESEKRGPLFAGDSCALQQHAARPSAYRERDSRGRLPLHVAAPRPQPDVLRVVLQGENGPGGLASVPVVTWRSCDRDGVCTPDPGGADGGGGHTSDSGGGGRPGGQRQGSAGPRSLATQDQQQERVPSADRYKHSVTLLR